MDRRAWVAILRGVLIGIIAALSSRTHHLPLVERMPLDIAVATVVSVFWYLWWRSLRHRRQGPSA